MSLTLLVNEGKHFFPQMLCHMKATCPWHLTSYGTVLSVCRLCVAMPRTFRFCSRPCLGTRRLSLILINWWGGRPLTPCHPNSYLVMKVVQITLRFAPFFQKCKHYIVKDLTKFSNIRQSKETTQNYTTLTS